MLLTMLAANEQVLMLSFRSHQWIWPKDSFWKLDPQLISRYPSYATIASEFVKA